MITALGDHSVTNLLSEGEQKMTKLLLWSIQFHVFHFYYSDYIIHDIVYLELMKNWKRQVLALGIVGT